MKGIGEIIFSVTDKNGDHIFCKKMQVFTYVFFFLNKWDAGVYICVFFFFSEEINLHCL